LEKPIEEVNNFAGKSTNKRNTDAIISISFLMTTYHNIYKGYGGPGVKF
jgi:hypothetical protein